MQNVYFLQINMRTTDVPDTCHPLALYKKKKILLSHYDSKWCIMCTKKYYYYTLVWRKNKHDSPVQDKYYCCVLLLLREGKVTFMWYQLNNGKCVLPSPLFECHIPMPSKYQTYPITLTSNRLCVIG